MFGKKREVRSLVDTKKISCPVRAIVGIGNNIVQGLGLLYQKPNGSAGFMNVWSHDDDGFDLIRFITEGESRIEWTVSVWSDGTEDKALSQIYIR